MLNIALLEAAYLAAEQQIKEEFCLRLKDGNKAKAKELAKKFSSKEIKDCYGLTCGVNCPLGNYGRGCLNQIIFDLLLCQVNNKDARLCEELNNYCWKKAGDFYLKHYCVNYVQEEMEL